MLNFVSNDYIGRYEKTIALRKENYRSVGRGDEAPSRNLKYMMHPD